MFVFHNGMREVASEIYLLGHKHQNWHFENASLKKVSITSDMVQPWVDVIASGCDDTLSLTLENNFNFLFKISYAIRHNLIIQYMCCLFLSNFYFCSY